MVRKKRKIENIKLKRRYEDRFEHCTMGNCPCTAKYWIGYEGSLEKVCDYHYRLFKDVQLDKLINKPEEERKDELEEQEESNRPNRLE